MIPVLIYLNYDGLRFDTMQLSMEDFLWMDLAAKMSDSGMYSELEKIFSCVPLYYGILLAGTGIITFFDSTQLYLLVRIDRRQFFLNKIAVMNVYAAVFSCIYIATLSVLFCTIKRESATRDSLYLCAGILIYMALVLILFSALSNLLAFRIGITSSMVLSIVLMSVLVVLEGDSGVQMFNPFCLHVDESNTYSIFSKCVVVGCEALFAVYILLIRCMRHDVLGAIES